MIQQVLLALLMIMVITMAIPIVLLILYLLPHVTKKKLEEDGEVVEMRHVIFTFALSKLTFIFLVLGVDFLLLGGRDPLGPDVLGILILASGVLAFANWWSYIRIKYIIKEEQLAHDVRHSS